jgi:hypothetical protein
LHVLQESASRFLEPGNIRCRVRAVVGLVVHLGAKRARSLRPHASGSKTHSFGDADVGDEPTARATDESSKTLACLSRGTLRCATSMVRGVGATARGRARWHTNMPKLETRVAHIHATATTTRPSRPSLTSATALQHIHATNARKKTAESAMYTDASILFLSAGRSLYASKKKNFSEKN